MGCANKKVITDRDPNFDFTQIKSVNVLAMDDAEYLALPYVHELLKSKLRKNFVTITEDANALLQFSVYVEERTNDQSISIGLGSQSGGRHSSIGIGTSVNLPIGDRTVDWQIMQLDLIVDQQVVWTAQDEAKISIRDGKGMNELHNKMLDRLLKQFPLAKQTEQIQ
ncbi:DUF4136 domain-containing protein [Alteromonas flava]|uniref:DUF4136 domain-containing protein n=1 Tax=Alteromonas flava TaxID=2048003 RepID=UPI000C2818C1|nr:DUF4136 domain-containing protein [Alteromonas flava]